MNKVLQNARSDYEYMQNYRVLQAAFERNQIKRYFDKLMKGKYQDNLEMLQWLMMFYQMNVTSDPSSYDAEKRRKHSSVAFQQKLSRDVSPKPNHTQVKVIMCSQSNDQRMKQKLSMPFPAQNFTEKEKKNNNPETEGEIVRLKTKNAQKQLHIKEMELRLVQKSQMLEHESLILEKAMEKMINIDQLIGDFTLQAYKSNNPLQIAYAQKLRHLLISLEEISYPSDYSEMMDLS